MGKEPSMMIQAWNCSILKAEAKNHHKYEASLDYIASSRQARACQIWSQKPKQKTKDLNRKFTEDG